MKKKDLISLWLTKVPKLKALITVLVILIVLQCFYLLQVSGKTRKKISEVSPITLDKGDLDELELNHKVEANWKILDMLSDIRNNFKGDDKPNQNISDINFVGNSIIMSNQEGVQTMENTTNNERKETRCQFHQRLLEAFTCADPKSPKMSVNLNQVISV